MVYLNTCTSTAHFINVPSFIDPQTGGDDVDDGARSLQR